MSSVRIVGGTTFDVGLIVNGRPLLRNTSIIDQRVMYCPTASTSYRSGRGAAALHEWTGLLGGSWWGRKVLGHLQGPRAMGAGESFQQQLMRTLCLVILGRGTISWRPFQFDREAAETALYIHVAKPLGITRWKRQPRQSSRS